MVDLNQLRADYRLCSDWLLRSEGWSLLDIDEMGRLVAEAVAADDSELIGCWAAWLAIKAIGIREFAARVRLAEERMRAACQAERIRNGEGGS